MDGIETVVDRIRSVYASIFDPIKTAIFAAMTMVTEIYRSFNRFLREYMSLAKFAQVLPGDCFAQVSSRQIQAGIEYLIDEDENALNGVEEPSISWGELLKCLASGIYGQFVGAFKQYVIPPLIQAVHFVWEKMQELYATVKPIIVQSLIRVGQIIKQAFIFVKDQAVMVAKKTVEVTSSVSLHYFQKLADFLLRFIPSSTARVNILMIVAIVIFIFVVFGPHTDLFVRKFNGLPGPVRLGITGTIGLSWLVFIIVKFTQKMRKRRRDVKK